VLVKVNAEEQLLAKKLAGPINESPTGEAANAPVPEVAPTITGLLNLTEQPLIAALAETTITKGKTIVAIGFDKNLIIIIDVTLLSPF
jgi:hypothetical protein